MDFVESQPRGIRTAEIQIESYMYYSGVHDRIQGAVKLGEHVFHELYYTGVDPHAFVA